MDNRDLGRDSDGHENYLNDVDRASRGGTSDESKFDPHQGHGEYLRELRDPFGTRFLESMSMWIAFLVALVCGRWGWIVGYDPHKIQLRSLFYGAVAFVAAFLFSGFFFGQLSAHREKWLACVGGFALFVFAFLVPVTHNAGRRAAAKESETQASARAQASYLDADGRAWRADMEWAGAHGPIGVEPPMLVVLDYGTELKLINVSDQSLGCITIYRVPGRREVASDPGCKAPALMVNCEHLAPHATFLFVPPVKSLACSKELLSYRIGDSRSGAASPVVSWWSDSELAEFDSRHFEWIPAAKSALGAAQP